MCFVIRFQFLVIIDPGNLFKTFRILFTYSTYYCKHFKSRVQKWSYLSYRTQTVHPSDIVRHEIVSYWLYDILYTQNNTLQSSQAVLIISMMSTCCRLDHFQQRTMMDRKNRQKYCSTHTLQIIRLCHLATERPIRYKNGRLYHQLQYKQNSYLSSNETRQFS